MTLADDRRMSPATFDLLFRLAPRSSDCVETLRSLMISCSLECQKIEFDSADATTNGPFILLLLLHTFIHRHVDIDIHKCTHEIANRDRDKKKDVTTESQIGGECVFTVSHRPSRRFVVGVLSVRLVQWSVDECVLMQDREELITRLLHSKILLTVPPTPSGIPWSRIAGACFPRVASLDRRSARETDQLQSLQSPFQVLLVH